MKGELPELIRQAILPDAAEITDAFYEGLLAQPEARRLLSHKLVRQRLRGAMIDWLRDLFAERGPGEEEGFRERQTQVGLVHARIDVPMHLVADGLTILKTECAGRLEALDLDRGRLMEAFLLVNRLLDEAGSLINKSYLTHALATERNDQSLRLHVLSHNLAIECERLRSDLFDWMRRTVLTLYRDPHPKIRQDDKLEHSTLGLWTAHKAALLFSDIGATQQLREQIRVVDQALEQAVARRIEGTGEAFEGAIAQLDQKVSEAAWLLSSLVDHALEGESVRDPLTRVFSRRYLPTVMQREVKISQQSGVAFAVFMIDIDNFKELNDRHGHAAGDAVLAGVGEVVLSTVRANDFVFRYGGDEFLAVVGHVTDESASTIAENLLSSISRHRFESDGQQYLTVSASVGFALHDGHPDYNSVVQRADEALLEAKAKRRGLVAKG